MNGPATATATAILACAELLSSTLSTSRTQNVIRAGLPHEWSFPLSVKMSTKKSWKKSSSSSSKPPQSVQCLVLACTLNRI